MLYYGHADLQLDVKGCRDVYASFDKYVEVERLEGDNKYHAENHGLQVPTCSSQFSL
jgi:ubiquitin carboxyl-terminal hydrolase 7